MRWCVGCLVASFILVLPAGAAPIHDATKKGDVAAIGAVLDAGADVNEVDVVTALYIASDDGNVKVASLLIDRGADVNLPARWGTPLYVAALRGHAEIVKLLLDHGAKPDQVWKSLLPLHVAAQTGCLTCVSLLVEAGADVNALTSLRMPAIHFAKFNGHENVVKYLSNHGARPPDLAPISARLGSADPGSGKEIYVRKCAACHFSAPGVVANPRPNLWGVVGRRKASANDFPYSPALREAGGIWTYEDLNAWISGPALYFPGTDMNFEGIEDEKQRADVIAFLRTLSDQPESLP
jgi:cytochrome c